MEFEKISKAQGIMVNVDVEVFEYAWRKANNDPAWDWRVVLAGGQAVSADEYLETEAEAIADVAKALGLP